jgi:hypothetical protein
MAGSLNYESEFATPTYYLPPRRAEPMRTLLWTALSALLVVVGAICYGQLQPDLDDLYLRGGALAVAAGAVGLLGMMAVRGGRVRSRGLAASIGLILSLLVLYVMWVAWVQCILTAWGMQVSWWQLAVRPVPFFRVIQYINETGAWNYNGRVIRGASLTVCWIGEAIAILGAGVLIPLKASGGLDPVCTDCGTRCKTTPNLPRFSDEREVKLIAALLDRDFDALHQHDAPANEDDPEIALRLMSCPKCGHTNVLTVSRIAWYVNRTGQATVKTEPIVNQLLITRNDSERLKGICAEIVEQRAASKEAEDADQPAETEENAT